MLAIVVMLAGLGALRALPIEQYPDIAPVQVNIRASYPGASAEAVENSVTQILEQQLTGIDGLLYFSSQSSSRGQASITAIFDKGTDPDIAQVQVQNKIESAVSRLPQQVQQQGVRVSKSNSDTLLIVSVFDKTRTRSNYDVSDYLTTNIQDPLSRVEGVGDVNIFGSPHAMRIWLNPQRLAAVALMPGDVVSAITAQNSEVAAGEVGGLPAPQGQLLTATVTAQSRLQTPEEFRNILLKTLPDGSAVRIRDVARVEIGAESYNSVGRLNRQPSSGMAISLSPGADALATVERVKARMAELAQNMPDGLDYAYINDTTTFIRLSVSEVQKALFEAIVLVIIVMFVFLQSWRATLIPAIAVPVVLLGTFAIFYLAGFSINTLTLFGLVLAIGIVVDDTIVVVENVERSLEDGMTPLEATLKAMREVSGAIVAIALVLCAVFVPLTLVPGLSGQFYKQFAATIAISTVISAITSLTLSPALAALLLRPHDAPKDALSRGIDRLFGRFFRRFNAFFHRGSTAYGRGVTGLLRRKSLAIAAYGVLLITTALLFVRVPTGFVPAPDKQYLIGIVQLPAGSTLDRTEQVIRRMTEIALAVPGIIEASAYPGLSIAGFSAATNEGIIFFGLSPFEERRSPSLSKDAILAKVNGAIQQIGEARLFVVPPPAVDGLGNVGGFKLQLQDRTGQGEQALFGAVLEVLAQVQTKPESKVGTPYSTYDINVPQLYADVDRVKAKQMGVALRDVYDTLQINLGSLYVTDFNRFGRTYQVIVQADAAHRASADNIPELKTRNATGEMVPLGALLKVDPTFGPTRVTRFNGFPSADFNGAPKAGYSSGAAEAEMERLLRSLPRGMTYEWTELSYQDRLTRDVAVPGTDLRVPTLVAVLTLSVVLVILVLAALYESWSLPLAIILIVPMCILSALAGLALSRQGLFGQPGDLNLFTQVALVVVVGLACKN
ncbi:MAG: efflux RND transporter permease subunit, partial [Sphingopyxis sp.]|nr:efflux RND transporter permease subunit [Sphingopyxis sp.]